MTACGRAREALVVRVGVGPSSASASISGTPSWATTMPVAWCTSARSDHGPCPAPCMLGASASRAAATTRATIQGGVDVDVAVGAVLVEREHPDDVVGALTHRQGVDDERSQGGQGLRLEQRPARVGAVDVEQVEARVRARGERVGPRPLADDVLDLLEQARCVVGGAERDPLDLGVGDGDGAAVAVEGGRRGPAQPVGQRQAVGSAAGQPAGQPCEEVVDVSHVRPSRLVGGGGAFSLTVLRAPVRPRLNRSGWRARRA